MNTENGIIKFIRIPEGLYYYKPSAIYLKQVDETKCISPTTETSGSQLSNMVSTVTENHKGYTQRQFENSKILRQLYHIVGCPTVENFKHILRQKIIRNCPVTIYDMNIVKCFYDAYIGALKEKTTRNIPTPVKNDLVEVPLKLIEQHCELIFCMDIMYINNMPMLNGIDRSLRYRTLLSLTRKVAKELYRAIEVVFKYYNKA